MKPGIKQEQLNEPALSGKLGAFTLIELLIVIAIMGILASLVFPIVGAVNRSKIRARATGELKQVEANIEGYKAKLGHYPPNDPNNNPASNPLYFELIGTTLQGTTFVTLDNSATNTVANLAALYGPAIGGFVNSSRGGGGDESASARKFLANPKPGTYLINTTDLPLPNAILGVNVEGPLMYKDANGSKINPFRYNSVNPTNNPQSYDLWIDVLVGGKTNRICNWSADPIKL